jgi:type III secretion system FlhB-like substrate exporter
MNNLVISKIKNKEIAINKYEELLEKLENTNFFNTIELYNHIDEIREYNITNVIYK